MENYSLHLPINGVSFGQVSMGILRCLHGLAHEPCIFPIMGQVDLSSQDISEDFKRWLESCMVKALRVHKRHTPIFKLWHLMGSYESFSNNQTLLTFYELDSPTAEEINTIKNNHKVLVTNDYTRSVFNMCGCDNVATVPLFFDEANFKAKDKQFFDDDRITFNVVGKLERRKNHHKLIAWWVKKYGNNTKFFLNCAIYNPFMSPEDNQKSWLNIVQGQRYFNVNYIGYMPKNVLYNDYLNSADVVIGLGTEGWGLPEFHSVGMGKHALLLNCAGYREWANADNAVLINPNEKIEVYDELFFRKGMPYNQGNIFTFSEEDFYSGCEAIINRVKQNRKNVNGFKLRTQFTVKNTVDKIFKEMGF